MEKSKSTQSIEELTLRVDAINGGAQAFLAMLLCLIETHPEPAKLLAALRVFRERTVANQIATPYSDALAISGAEVFEQFEKQALLRLEKSASQ